MKLDKLIKDSKLVERLDKLDPDNASGSKNDGINYWKGKKIVTLAEWKRKLVRGGKLFQKGTEEDQRIKAGFSLKYLCRTLLKRINKGAGPVEPRTISVPLKDSSNSEYN